MAIKTYMSINKPDDVEVSLTVIMPLSDQIKVQETLDLGPHNSTHWHPATQMSRSIKETVSKIKKDVFDYRSKDELDLNPKVET